VTGGRTILLLALTALWATSTAAEPLYVNERYQGNVRALVDLNGDGDALDVGENTLWATGLSDVADLAWRPGAVYALDSIAGQIVRLTDVNGDGDALDVGEAVVWSDGLSSPGGLGASGATGLYATQLADDTLWRFNDLNGDGDASDVGEKTLFADGLAGPTAVRCRGPEVFVISLNTLRALRLVDVNGDGDALDVGEVTDYTPMGFSYGLTGLLATPDACYVSDEFSNTVYLVEDRNGDGDALDVVEMLTYADTVFGDLMGPAGMCSYPEGILLTEQYSGQVSLLRDANGDGDCLDVGEAVLFADGLENPTAIVPEPATLALLALGGLILGRQRTRVSRLRSP